MSCELGKELAHWYRLPTKEQKWIPLEDMQVGYYLADSRNFDIGYWNGKEFEYKRTKWNFVFDDTEEHYDRGAPYGTVRPIRYLGESL